MSCTLQEHTWTRSGSTLPFPPIEKDERCDCGQYTYGECDALQSTIAVQAQEIARLTRLVESHTQWLHDHVATHQPECACGPCATWRQLTQANERVAALTAKRDALKEKLQVSQGAYVNVFKERDALAAKVAALRTMARELILELIVVCPDHEHEGFHKEQLAALEATP